MGMLIAEGAGMLIGFLLFMALPPIICVVLARKLWLQGRTVWGYVAIAALVLIVIGTQVVRDISQDITTIAWPAGLLLLIACAFRAYKSTT